ncbi:cytochrome P450 [Saccharothrix xinjiangensis]|uniref:Cytochrome P450 n=1 Tax=Saccharothrix xinjiangensis TaxID=204798 RepID=A0ABV9XS09_9PSEU
MPTLPLHMRRAGFDPAPELSAQRDEGVRLVDVPQGDRVWLVTRIADVREVLGDPRRFGNSPHHVVPGAPALSEEELAAVRPGNPLAFDPPEHTRLRRLVAGEFTGRRMRWLEPRVHEVVRDRLDALERGGPPADLVTGFALPVPALVICEMLGVPFADRDAFQDRYARFFDVTLASEERLGIALESRAYLAELARRARSAPGDDLLGTLVRSDLGEDEVVGLADLLLLAGHETTANMLSLGVATLLAEPDRRARLLAAPEVVVEELLRWLTVVPTGVPRIALVETELGGRAVLPGDLVICSLPAANRDPELVPDPDALDLGRQAGSHVAFGHGVHHCLGAPLARMEMRIAFQALLTRFPDLRVVSTDLVFRSEQAVYGLDELLVEW